MRKIIGMISNAINSFKNSMDQYGEACIIVSASLVNNSITRQKSLKNQPFERLHLPKQSDFKNID